jgi:TPR repeat protein
MHRLLVLVALLFLGCASTSTLNYEELSSAARAGQEVDVGELREAFLTSPDFPQRMKRLGELETEAIIRFIEEEPLRLGPIGTAILDQYHGSLAGHYALATFYDYVDSANSATIHHQWVSRIQADVESENDGTRESPYAVLSTPEAIAYLKASGLTPVGSMYQTTTEVPFMIMVAAKPDQGRIANVYFNLEATYNSVRNTIDQETRENFNPGTLIGLLARRDDSAAQAFVGTYLATENRLEEAVEWLSASSRTGNFIANMMLARVYYSKARRLAKGPARDEAMELVMQNYLHAIAIGSDEAMYTLGTLYLNEDFGKENTLSGLPLLKQATDLENTNAMIHLAQLHYEGLHVSQDFDESEQYFVRAASLNADIAKIHYARFLMNPTVEKKFHAQAYKWLKDLAKNDAQCQQGEKGCTAAEAKVLIGNLYATGTHVNRSFRRAQSWFKSAVTSSLDDPSIVNEVAWTLAVTNLARLRDERYALEIMDRMMNQDTSARETPAYLDTWAATYAANGQHEKAVKIQQKALDKAVTKRTTDILQVLQDHLDLFEAGQTITDPIP